MAKIQTVLSDDKNDWEHRVAAVSLAWVRTRTTVNPLLSPVLISNNHPSPPSYYSSLISDRLCQSITTVTLCVDWSRMVDSSTGSSDLYLIRGCMTSTSNLLYLNFSTLYHSSLWRTDTIVFAKLNKPSLSNKPPRLYQPPLLKCRMSEILTCGNRRLGKRSRTIATKFTVVTGMPLKTAAGGVWWGGTRSQCKCLQISRFILLVKPR